MENAPRPKTNIWRGIGYTALGLVGVTGLSLAYSDVGTSSQPTTTNTQQATVIAVQQPQAPTTSEVTLPVAPSSATPSPRIFGTTLGLGSSGTSVANLQQFLADEHLYSGRDTGVFDQTTVEAVTAFENQQNLTPADGIFGPKEQAAANLVMAAHPDWLTTLSNGGAYSNINGSTVHKPAYSSNGIPAGASAVCGDGTYSFSMHHSGTCSHHGGVSQWLQ